MAFVIMSYKKIMNNFEVIKTPIKDLVVIQPKVLEMKEDFSWKHIIKSRLRNWDLRWNLFKIIIQNRKKAY